jgi:hypothetical protein
VQNIGLVENVVELNLLLKSLRTTIFIDNWLARCNASNLESRIKIFRDALQSPYIDSFANIEYVQEMQKYFKDNSELKIKDIINTIPIKLKNNTSSPSPQIDIDISNPGLCGGDNCFKIYTDADTNEKYGIRFSNQLYAPGTTELYNKINGMLNNAIIYSMMELFNLKFPPRVSRQSGIRKKPSASRVLLRNSNIESKIAKIQEMTQVGLIKVILSVDGTKYGYIPYIITKNSDTQIDIQKYIEEKIYSDVVWSEDNIKTFIFDLIEIFIFYLIDFFQDLIAIDQTDFIRMISFISFLYGFIGSLGKYL